MSSLYGNGINLTEKVMDFLWTRQTVTMNNIANVDTPDYKSQYVTFEEELESRIKNAAKGMNSMRDVSSAIDFTNLKLHTTSSETDRLDGNNVDMDQEQVDLVRTTYEYQTMLNSLNSEISRLRTAAKTF